MSDLFGSQLLVVPNGYFFYLVVIVVVVISNIYIVCSVKQEFHTKNEKIINLGGLFCPEPANWFISFGTGLPVIPTSKSVEVFYILEFKFQIWTSF
jgi:hypothetical protein